MTDGDPTKSIDTQQTLPLDVQKAEYIAASSNLKRMDSRLELARQFLSKIDLAAQQGKFDSESMTRDSLDVQDALIAMVEDMEAIHSNPDVPHDDPFTRLTRSGDLRMHVTDIVSNIYAAEPFLRAIKEREQFAPKAEYSRETSQLSRKLGSAALSPTDVVDQSKTEFRRTISIPDGEFKGDPRRVPGHPSNQNNEAIAAYVEQLNDIESKPPQLEQIQQSIDEIKQLLDEIDQVVPAWRFVSAINSDERDNAAVKLSTKGKALATEWRELDQERRKLES